MSTIWGKCQKIELLAFVLLTAWCITNSRSIKTSGLYAYIGVCTPIKDTPFGDHLVPGIQSWADEGQPPERSLRGFCERARPQRIEEVDAPSHDALNHCIRPRLEICLESNEIPHEIVYHRLLTRRRECHCQGERQIGDGRRILAADPMR